MRELLAAMVPKDSLSSSQCPPESNEPSLNERVSLLKLAKAKCPRKRVWAFLETLLRLVGRWFP